MVRHKGDGRSGETGTTCPSWRLGGVRRGGDRSYDIVYVRGSLYDEEERWRRRRRQGKPVIVHAEPR
jgi:hypothetical protein